MPSVAPVFLVRLPDGSERVCSTREEAVIALGNGGWIQTMRPTRACASCHKQFQPKGRYETRCKTCKKHRFGKAVGLVLAALLLFPGCAKPYAPGSHEERIEEFKEQLREEEFREQLRVM